MRENLVKSDLVECVIGIGKNLFSIHLWRHVSLYVEQKKNIQEKGKYFINAKNEVTRKMQRVI